jgi:hypothetical protein
MESLMEMPLGVTPNISLFEMESTGMRVPREEVVLDCRLVAIANSHQKPV